MGEGLEPAWHLIVLDCGALLVTGAGGSHARGQVVKHVEPAGGNVN